MKINETSGYEAGFSDGYYNLNISIDGDLNVVTGVTEQVQAILCDASYDIQKKMYEFIVRNHTDTEQIRNGVVAGLKSLFDEPIYFKEIPNEYYNSAAMSYQSPWFIVTTTKGPIRVGWRKRVIEINWFNSDICTTAEKLFPEESVTKQNKMIHAWGYDKAREYLNRILS